MSAGAMERVLEQTAVLPASNPFASSHNVPQTPGGRKRACPTDSGDIFIPSPAEAALFASPPTKPTLTRSHSVFATPTSSVTSQDGNVLTSPTAAYGQPAIARDIFASPSTALAMSLSQASLDCSISSVASDLYSSVPASPTRPDLKRRKTAPQLSSPDMHSSSASPRKMSSPEKRAAGRDGAEVWPADVEEAFFTALNIVPKLGRRKVLVNGKPCGRNELIADYIFRKTKKLRSRKQVSSHIQVLKNIKRDDAEFMRLVAEPLDGEEVFSAEAIAQFGGSIQFCGSAPTGVVSSPASAIMSHSNSEGGLLAPNSYGMYRSQSATTMSGPPSPLLSPAVSDSSGPSLATPGIFSLNSSQTNITSQPMTSGLSSAFKELTFPAVPIAEFATVACPILPYQLCIWSEAAVSGEGRHTFATVDRKVETALKSRKAVYLEESPLLQRLPHLTNMHNHLPCQFLHIKLNFAIPQSHQVQDMASVHTKLLLSSMQDVPLTAVTTIYSAGQSLSVHEVLPSATRLMPLSSSLISIGSSPSSSPDSPETPNSTSGSPPSIGPKHKYSYAAPFAAEFWSGFVRNAGLEAALETLVIVQEFVVRPDESSVMPPAEPISPGAAIGDVVLVVVYEFGAHADSDSFLGSPNLSEVSFLSLRRMVPAALPHKRALYHMPISAPVPRRPSAVSRSSSLLSTELSIDPMGEMPALVRSGEHQLDSTLLLDPTVPEIKFEATSPMVTTNAKLPRTERKPNLSLNIPTLRAASAGLDSGPITPLPQVVHTPNCPPPVVQPLSPSLRNRLNPIWAAQANDWNLDSPALMGAFPQADLAPPLYTASLPSGMAEHDAGAALNWMTATALAAGTPSFLFNQEQSHDMPFLMSNHASSLDFSAYTCDGDYFSAPSNY